MLETLEAEKKTRQTRGESKLAATAAASRPRATTAGREPRNRGRHPAGIDMALWLVGQLHDPASARRVRHYAEYHPAPPYAAEVWPLLELASPTAGFVSFETS